MQFVFYNNNFNYNFVFFSSFTIPNAESRKSQMVNTFNKKKKEILFQNVLHKLMIIIC